MSNPWDASYTADALNLGSLSLTADTIIDSGVFHVFSDEDRPGYVASLASVLRSGGCCWRTRSKRRPGLRSSRLGDGPASQRAP